MAIRLAPRSVCAHRPTARTAPRRMAPGCRTNALSVRLALLTVSCSLHQNSATTTKPRKRPIVPVTTTARVASARACTKLWAHYAAGAPGSPGQARARPTTGAISCRYLLTLNSAQSLSLLKDASEYFRSLLPMPTWDFDSLIRLCGIIVFLLFHSYVLAKKKKPYISTLQPTHALDVVVCTKYFLMPQSTSTLITT